MKFYVSDLKGELGGIIDKHINHRDSVLLEQEENHFEIWAIADCILLEDLEIYVVPTVTYVYIPAKKMFQSGQNCFFFYDKNGTELHFEGGCSLYEAIKYFCEIENIAEPEKLKCVYQLDQGKFLREKVVNKKNSDNEG